MKGQPRGKPLPPNKVIPDGKKQKSKDACRGKGK